MVGDKFIIIYSYSELVNGNSASSARMMNYARALAENVSVILLSFERNEQIKKCELIKVEEKIYTVGIGNSSKRQKRGIKYIADLIKFVKDIHKLVVVLGKENLVSFILYPQYRISLDIISILYFKMLKRYKLYCEINEIRRFSSDIEAVKPKNFKIWLIKKWLLTKYKISEWLSRFYDGLICISTNIETYYKKYNKNTIRVPILSDSVSMEIEKDKLRFDKNFKMGFFGSVHYNKENLEVLMKCLSLLRNEYHINNFTVDFYGRSDAFSKNKLMQESKKLGLKENIKYFGEIEQKEVKSKMSNYHLLLLPRGNNLQNKYGFSTKLAEYLSSGVPVLITNVSDNGLYIKDNINGFIVSPDDREALLKKLLFIFDNYNSYASKISKRAIETINKYFLFENYSESLYQFVTNSNK